MISNQVTGYQKSWQQRWVKLCQYRPVSTQNRSHSRRSNKSNHKELGLESYLFQVKLSTWTHQRANQRKMAIQSRRNNPQASTRKNSNQQHTSVSTRSILSVQLLHLSEETSIKCGDNMLLKAQHAVAHLQERHPAGPREGTHLSLMQLTYTWHQISWMNLQWLEDQQKNKSRPQVKTLMRVWRQY